MEGYISIIKYYPDNNRDEGFGIGLILISPETNCNIVKISEKRINRINNAWGIKKSTLIDLYLKDIKEREFDVKLLNYLSVYENGNIRFTRPKVIVGDDLTRKFNELYEKFVADYLEKDISPIIQIERQMRGHYSRSLQNKFKKNEIISNNLNIGYNFKDDQIGEFLIGSSSIDFVGGNGTIFAGEIIDLNLSEESISKSFNKIITLFEAFEKSLPEGKFSPKECKLLVLKEQAEDPLKADYMEKLCTWQKKAEYDIIIRNSIDDFEKEIEEKVSTKKIMKFNEWIKHIAGEFI